MINVIKSEDRHTADHGWLQTHWHFSFGDYFDPENVSWSKLRVFNDGVVQVGCGFGMHPHRDIEGLTYVVEGLFGHEDNVGGPPGPRNGAPGGRLLMTS